MKKYVQEATDINIWKSIQQNLFDRSEDIKSFIEGLDLIEGNAFISLDAKWGEGKTFFVRQIEEVLKYVVAKQWTCEENPIEKMPSYEYLKNNSIVNTIKLRKMYLPIYYNAWMYDNHSDPLMSLLLIMTKICQGVYETKINSEKITEDILSIMSSLPIRVKGINPIDVYKELRSGDKDILSVVQTEEDIKECVKNIFKDIIVERTQKLIIFIDELDRCKPSFAIEMLERIKHYFDDERIIFVVSVNKEQLVYTISNYYGSGFDATRYLNKFFDINLNLPEMNSFDKHRVGHCDDNTNENYWLVKIADELGDFYHLSLRDKLIYKSCIENALAKKGSYISGEFFLISLFVACILLLDIVDLNEKKKFLEGKSSFIEDILPQVDIYKKFVVRVTGDGNIEKHDEQFKTGCEEIIKIYKYAFESEKEEYYEKFDITRDLKQKCIKACNGHTY